MQPCMGVTGMRICFSKLCNLVQVLDIYIVKEIFTYIASYCLSLLSRLSFSHWKFYSFPAKVENPIVFQQVPEKSKCLQHVSFDRFYIFSNLLMSRMFSRSVLVAYLVLFIDKNIAMISGHTELFGIVFWLFMSCIWYDILCIYQMLWIIHYCYASLCIPIVHV